MDNNILIIYIYKMFQHILGFFRHMQSCIGQYEKASVICKTSYYFQDIRLKRRYTTEKEKNSAHLDSIKFSSIMACTCDSSMQLMLDSKANLIYKNQGNHENIHVLS
jgi:hypothetical protein